MSGMDVQYSQDFKLIIRLFEVWALGFLKDHFLNKLELLPFFQVNANELTNGVINAAFMLLFKDAIRLFAAYNEGIINLLGKNKLMVITKQFYLQSCTLHYSKMKGTL